MRGWRNFRAGLRQMRKDVRHLRQWSDDLRALLDGKIAKFSISPHDCATMASLASALAATTPSQG